MPAKTLLMSGQDRRAYGVVATLREQNTDQRIVVHRKGPAPVEQVAELCDHLEGDWRVLCISNPETVYRDLQGTRARQWADSIDFPETHMLGHIDRLDLLDACFIPRVRPERGRGR